MKFTLYDANCSGQAKNCKYPRKCLISNAEDLAAVAAFDHVTARFNKNYRSKANFIECDADVLDCDNDHSDNSTEWIYPEMYEGLFKDVSYVVVPSRNDGKPKNNRSARPRHHVYFPHKKITSLKDCEDLKKAIYDFAPFFDDGAIDGARFIFGCETKGIIWHEGSKSIDEFLAEKGFADFDKATENIQEGSRNKSMSLLAGKIIKRFGNTDEALRIYLDKATLCTPPLDDGELMDIWNSAVKFGKQLEQQPGYIPPEEYNKKPEWETPIPFDE
ncbi:MAG: primase alpha helix C-terminal domain-containing protein, partial [Acidaminococcaceae bacterium]|nr:primase alpha helix C-terminal domain-containing protein [Acidaminococcaceae bacterium]